MALSFDYQTCPMSAIKVTLAKDAKGKERINKIILPNGLETVPTKRFWKTWQMRFKQPKQIFKLYSPDEVFQRISQVQPNDQIRTCTEVGEVKNKLISVTNPSSAYITFDNLTQLLATYGAEKCDYVEGVVRSRHIPRRSLITDICGDLHENRFIVDTPIDGFGKPNVYIGLLRQVCSNGAIAVTPSFRSELVVGKKNDSIEHRLSTCLESFNNEEGYEALISRFTTAAGSWASVKEVMMTYRLLMKMYNEKEVRNVKLMKIGASDEDVSFYDNIPPLKAFMNMTGDLNKTYGLSNLDTLSEKKQRIIPAPCKMYDVLNFCSEMASHHMNARGSRAMSAAIGTFVSDEYDLENTCSKYGDWKDFFAEKVVSDVVTSLNN